MTVDNRNQANWAKQLEERGRAIETAQGLKGGGGGGTFDGMEARVAKLESGVDDIKKSLSEIRVTLASIDERTKHMATKWEVVVILGVMTGLIGGIVALTARFIN